MNNILLLGASFGTGNLGVGALTAGALTVVKARYPAAQVSLLDYGRTPASQRATIGGRSLVVPLINLRFSWKLALPNNVATLLALSWISGWLGEGARRWLLDHHPWLGPIARADMAIAVSGGDSFSDIYGLGRFFYVCLPQWLVTSLGVKLVLLPQTLGPFKHSATRALARRLLRRASRVYARDRAGVATAQALLDRSSPPARFCHDLGFVLEPRPPRDADLGGLAQRPGAATRPLVGLNVSGLLLMGGYNRRNMFGLGLDYGELVARLVERLVRERGVDILLVPHVFSNDGECDACAVASVHEHLSVAYPDHLFAARGHFDQSEIKHVIGRCDFFIGARMHACIAALSQGIPAVGVAYSDKFAGVFDSVGVGALVVDPRQLGVEAAVQAVLDAFDGREATAAQLKAVLPGVRRHVLGLLDDLG